MKRIHKLLAIVSLAMASTPAAAESAKGDWAGVIDGTKLRVLVHVTQAANGLAGTLDSPDQGAFGIPIAEIVTTDDAFAFAVPTLSARYEAKWDTEAKAWKGQWRQGNTTVGLSFAAVQPPPPLPANWQVPPDAEIARLIEARIAPRKGEGIVIGVLDPSGQRIVARGPSGSAAFGGTTIFEIGSISKVFTALLLSDMVNEGQVALDDPAEKYLPAGSKMPERGGRKITLKDLATHHSGLPRLPDNLSMADPADPYADYTVAQMLEFLGRYQLPRDIGAQYEYSNLGVGLLGYLLSRAAGTDYPTLLRQRITGPLGMADTVVALSPAQAARLAQGYDAYMQPAKPWNLPTLVGAGGIRSTAPDMLKFLAAALDPNSPIGPAMKTALSVREEMGTNPLVKTALGWMVVTPEPGREVLMHDGGTGGYRSSIALEPAKRRADVVLANSGAEPSTNDIAIHLLIGSPVAPTGPVPPPPPVVKRTEVKLSAAELDRVVGRYELAPGMVIEVKRRGDALTAQLTGQPVFPIFPEAPLAFFLRVVDAQLRFTADAAGKVTGVVLDQNGRQLPGKRLD